jgi:peroxiredoxin
MAQETSATSVSEILAGHDRALVRELSIYLTRNPKADDRDQAYAALFNKVIEHDWFSQTEELAKQYLKEEPDGPVRSLAQIITTMAQAQSGRFDLALSRYKDLMQGLGKVDQEEFAVSFTETLATAAIAAGEFTSARQVYQTLQARFPESQSLQDKTSKELNRLEKVGRPAPMFEAQDLTGKTMSREALRGRFILVDFWATWCAPCIAELPRLQDAYRKYHGSGLEILSVSLDETRAAVVDFVKVRKLPWLQVHNATGGADLVEAFGVSSIPASYLIDREGTIIHLDPRGPALETILAKLLKTAGQHTAR